MSAGLYVHIPFCKRKCAYCDFVSFAEPSQMLPYIKALELEIRLRAKQEVFRDFDTVFIGGGTPSILPPEAIARLLDALHTSFSISQDAEISMESNPGTLTKEGLHVYREAGVNRLSIGLQSSDDALLARIGRIHSYADFLEAYDLARSAGFSNINVDIMYGLPGQSMPQYEDTLRRLCALAPEHISAYSLILEENTPLYTAHDDLPDEDESYEMHLLTRQYLKNAGYMRYEISNYTRPGFECRHNLHYWNDERYLGLGLNAHSAWRFGEAWTRFANTSELSEYLRRLNCGDNAEAVREQITPTDEMFEFVMLGLRKTQGLSKQAFQARFGKTIEQVYPDALCVLKKEGFSEETGEYLRLNERGLDMQNAALLHFLGDENA